MGGGGHVFPRRAGHQAPTPATTTAVDNLLIFDQVPDMYQPVRSDDLSSDTEYICTSSATSTIHPDWHRLILQLNV